MRIGSERRGRAHGEELKGLYIEEGRSPSAQKSTKKKEKKIKTFLII